MEHEIKVNHVAPRPNDVLYVEGTVNDIPVRAQGHTSWTKLFWTEQPADPELHDEMTHDEREAVMQAHRDACEAARRPMTAAELRDYCETLLLEAAGIYDVDPLHVEPILG